MRIVGGQAVPYGLDISLKRSLEDSRNSLTEKSTNLSICFNGKGTLADPLSLFFVLIFTTSYKLSESSWEPEESMFDPSYMIEKFRVDALKEGIDIDKEETGVILLQVAKDPSVPQPT